MSSRISAPGTQRVYVYDLPLRLWHWFNALSIVALCVTGYLIASPPVVAGGEASDHFLMGNIRFVHFTAGYLLAVGFLFRVYWAFAGNQHARQLFLPPLLSAGFWEGVWHEVRWYAFIDSEPRKYTGHNPLAVLFMHLVLVWGTLFMVTSGLALYGEGEGLNSWQYRLFSSWMLPLFGQSQGLHSLHHLVMWLMVCFIIMHIYVAVREDKMSRQSILATMVTGWREFRDDKPVDDGH